MGVVVTHVGRTPNKESFCECTPERKGLQTYRKCLAGGGISREKGSRELGMISGDKLATVEECVSSTLGIY